MRTDERTPPPPPRKGTQHGREHRRGIVIRWRTRQRTSEKMPRPTSVGQKLFWVA